MTADWRRDYWREHETDAEHADRVESAEREASVFFAEATVPQTAVWRETMEYLAPFRGALWERRRADALRLFRENTKDAAALFEATAEEIMHSGEVSEETSAKWDSLIARNSMVEAAE